MSYPNLQSYLAALPSLVAGGASLHDLYTALRDVEDPSPRVFVDGLDPAGRGGEVSLTNVDTYQRDSWRTAIVELCGDGTLDRARVLRSCLEALDRDYSSYRAGWYSRTYKALQSNAHEAARDQDVLCATLGSRMGASVSLAVSQLAAVQKAKLLDADAFVASCAPAFTGTKVAAMGAFDERIHEVIRMATGTEPRRPLLATPTDEAGWVAPTALVRRYRSVVELGVEPLPADLTQALLRLGEDGRAEAAADLRTSGKLSVSGKRILTALESGDTGSTITDSIAVEWRSKTWSWGSGENKGTSTAWWPAVRGASGFTGRLISNPGLIRSHSAQFGDELHPLLIDELAIVHPPSTLHVVAYGLRAANDGIDLSEARYSDERYVTALRRHPGRWFDATAQLLALTLSAKRAEVRSAAAELFTEAVPRRYSAADTATSMAACVPACILTRWASSLADAASISTAGSVAVVDVLSALLPQVDRSTRGIGKLLEVLLNESLRLGRVADDAVLREWLTGFKGSSLAARHAKQLLAD